MSDKPSFFHTTEFNVWIVTAFFNAFACVTLVILPMTGLHALGVAAGRELSKHDAPAKREAPPRPDPRPRPADGIPVALSSAGDGR